jgi:hypothetical protein
MISTQKARCLGVPTRFEHASLQVKAPFVAGAGRRGVLFPGSTSVARDDHGTETIWQCASQGCRFELQELLISADNEPQCPVCATNGTESKGWDTVSPLAQGH